MTEYKLSASLEEHEDDVSLGSLRVHHGPEARELIALRSAVLSSLIHPLSSPPQEMLLSVYGKYYLTARRSMTAQFLHMAPPSSMLSPTSHLLQTTPTAW